MKKLLLSILLTASSVALNAQTWTEQSTAFPVAGTYTGDLSMVNANTVWAMAQRTSTTNHQRVSITTNGGTSWSTVAVGLPSTTTLGIGNISAVSATTAYISVFPVSGSPSTQGVYVTTNSGATWTKQTTAAFGASSFTNMVHFWDANNGVAMGDPVGAKFEIYTTINGGTTWTAVPAANIPASLAGGEYGYTGKFTVKGNTIWFGTDRGRLFRSTDKGLNWTAISTPVADFGGGTTTTTTGEFAFKDDNTGIIERGNYTGAPPVYTSLTLFKTTDGGATWNDITPAMTPATMVYYGDISYAGSMLVSAGSSTGNFGSSFSNNDGTSWTTIDGASHTCLEFLSSTVGFSGGFTTSATVGGAYKFNPSLSVADFNNTSEFTAYPNPTTGIVKLSSSINTVSDVAVYNLLGKQVYTKAFSALNNEVEVDLSSLNTGVYFLKATSNNGGVQTIKIVKD